MNAAVALPRTHDPCGDVPAAPVARVRSTPRAVFAPAGDRDERLTAAWTSLADDAAEPNSFAEQWFTAAGLDSLKGAKDVRLFQLWHGDALIGVLPLVVVPRYGRVPIAYVQNWRHANDFLGAPLVRAGWEQLFWTEALKALDAADWARGFLHINSLVEGGPVHSGLVASAAALGRPCDVVNRVRRALLASQLSPESYYADTVRKKKRKELGRLQRRLGELGEVTTASLAHESELAAWCDAFLALEHGGWKGRAGSSLASAAETEAFFRAAVAGAFAAGKLEFRRMDLDGRPIAMLINFIAPPGSFSFKTAFDEAYAKFSPGVLIQLDNFRLMERPDIDWMDSCAAQDHPMIDSLWGERRSVVRVSVPLAGLRRGLEYKIARTLEEGSARWRERRTAKERHDAKEQHDG